MGGFVWIMGMGKVMEVVACKYGFASIIYFWVVVRDNAGFLGMTESQPFGR